MFYQGDLQSGISKAVQESKLVACFVTDEEEESQLWESEFLTDSNIQSLLPDSAVLLRMIAGSQEAGYLAAIFPLPKTPTLVVIRHGELKEYIVSGVTKEDFVKRFSTALGGTTAQPSTTTSTPVTQATSSSSNPTSPTQSAAMQTMLAERRAKLDIHKKEQEAVEKAKREAAAAARKEAAAANPDSKAGNEQKYANMQKKRQAEAREERARILKRVEDDKIERREKEAERKAQTAALNEAEKKLEDSTALKSTNQRSKSECALQVRLFDGTTIRSRFPAKGSLRRDVRPWIDAQQEGDAPYTFKLVLTPLPNKNVEASEEEQSLLSLGLTPSATLILLPVADFTSAYEGKGVLGKGYGLVSSGFGAVGGLLGSVLGTGALASAPVQESENTTAGPSNTDAITARVRTLRIQEEKKDDRQFYNGNALNFEPRKDDDDDESQKKND